jgi:hypothetical protein
MPATLPWYWGERVTPQANGERSSGFDTIGVGRFLKDIGILAVPMAFVASGFALYMNSKIADIKEIIHDAVAQHALTEKATLVSRVEWEAYQKMEELRWNQIQRDSEQNSSQIRRNTILLERISNKLGIQRQNGD